MNRTCLITRSIVAGALALATSPACGDTVPCPGNADAIGTSRVLPVDATIPRRVGRKHFAQTLPLAPNEVVLTFDDGPAPATTPRVIEALAHECARATFFLLGRNALAHPMLARRELSDGHTVAHHTFSHPLLDRMSPSAAEADIVRGFAAVDQALYGGSEGAPRTPIFRFPGFASTPALLDWLERRGIAVFGADLWASDWNRMSPNQELALILGRIQANRGGIVLLHDTQPRTAAMLPALLRALKARNYKIVHVTAEAAGRN
jgi:peptidoglycan-N-acetylglucosamine deacetylase